MRRALTHASLIAAALCAPALVQAQSTGANPGRVASINPFVILFGYFSGEYEHRVRPTLALAVAGSSGATLDEYENDRMSGIDLKARLYPNEKALQGFGMAAGVGYARARREFYSYGDECRFGVCTPIDSPIECTVEQPCIPTLTKKTFSAPSFSIEFTYQWLLGRQKATAFTVGFGAKRVFASREDWGGYERVVPTGKLNVGYAF